MGETYCCERMSAQIEHHCEQHGQDCADKIVARYGNGTFVIPIHDGGHSGIYINYCPWCGQHLAEDAPRASIAVGAARRDEEHHDVMARAKTKR